jgi:hypothetical protein
MSVEDDCHMLAFKNHFAMVRAIEAVWRKALMILRSSDPISTGDLADAVLAKCPNADRKYVVHEFCRRIESYRPRPRRR